MTDPIKAEASTGASLPRLTKPQLARLVEIGMADDPRTDTKPATTAALIELGCADIDLRTWAGTRAVEITSLGLRILATLPGPEFDRFRDALATLTGDPHARTD